MANIKLNIRLLLNFLLNQRIRGKKVFTKISSRTTIVKRDNNNKCFLSSKLK